MVEIKLQLHQCFATSLIVLLSVLDLYYCSCPDVCEPCMGGHLYCVNAGLTEIPTINERGLLKVTIQKQRFISPDLSSANFSSFIEVTQLSIRTSNINKVLPLTFSKLTSLQQLDLSDNAELIIKQNAFKGLNLQVLKLDNMGIITLDLDAFHGLSVRSLSIQNSKLLTLPLKLVQPISKSLMKLYLKNNLLRTLDPQLQPIFQSIEVLELQKNPFICNCSILWLSKILQLTALTHLKTIEPTFDNSEEIHPSCVSPPELRKKFLHDITNKLTNCSPPKIIRIDISFESLSSAVIDCFTDDNFKDVHQQTSVGWLPSNDTSRLRRSVKVIRQSSHKGYLCRAANANGNSEILFQIEWFKLPKELNHSSSIPAIRHGNNTRDRNNILYRNVFSLIEMIFAIVGTLIITVIIFIILCCCHRCRIHIPFLEKERKLHNYATPPLYERGMYIDERRLYETEIDGRLFPPPPPTPPPFPMNRMIL